MKVKRTAIPDVVVIEPEVFRDSRGYFLETWNEVAFKGATGVNLRFVQDNQARSRRFVVRGLHYQLHRPQGKLVRATRGRIFDVAVDLRRSSHTFSKWVGVELSGDSHRQVWIPPGFAHGYLVLSDEADVAYKVTDYYAAEWERTIAWNDVDLNIAWPLSHGTQPILSVKDAAGGTFVATDTFI